MGKRKFLVTPGRVKSAKAKKEVKFLIYFKYKDIFKIKVQPLTILSFFKKQIENGKTMKYNYYNFPSLFRVDIVNFLLLILFGLKG